jgi:hypothetical protein
MAGCAWLSTVLDQEMLESRVHVPGLGFTPVRGTIASRRTKDDSLPIKTGMQVWQELGGRWLLHYLPLDQIGAFTDGSVRKHFVTPTAYAPEDSVSYLDLPAPQRPRTHVLLLDPRIIQRIAGPRWVRLGIGIEYFLPDGFPKEALIQTWAMVVK